MKKPNVLFILTDQQRYDTIGANGNRRIFTPHLDRLAGQGVVFDRAYTSSPECVPARCVMMTGLAPHQTGVYDNGGWLDPQTPTVQRLLREAGYLTQAVGKMHFKPAREGFGMERLCLSEEIPEQLADDEFLTELRAAGFTWAEEPHGMRSHLYYVPQVSQLPDAWHTTTWTGRRTAEFIRGQAGGGAQPWFCWTGFMKPHPPFDPTVPFNTLYDPLEMPLPVRGPGDLDAQNYYQKVQNLAKWMDLGPDPHFLQAQKAHYWACVSMVDRQVGEIVRALEETGQRENTLIIFSADHGEFLGDHHSWGKRSWYEGPGRLPMILSWPGAIQAGQRREQLVDHTDLLPTILAAAGLATPREAHGLNLLDFCGQEGAAGSAGGGGRVGRVGREILFGQLGQKGQGLYLAMDRQWKYIYCARDRREQLFNYAADPDELVNQAGAANDPTAAGHREAVAAKARLKAALVARFKREGYLDPLDGDEFRVYAEEKSSYEKVLEIGRQQGAIVGGARQYARWNDRYKNVFKPEGRVS